MNILLCCSGGMSTSLLASKMEKVAKQEGIEVKIQAVPVSEVRNYLDDTNVILIGPQVRFVLNDIKKIGEEKGIPVETINPIHYGTCNGTEVLKFAIALVSK